MKRLLGLALLLAAGGTTLWASPPADFDVRVEALRQRAGVAGLVLAIVENGQVTLARNDGVKKLDSPEPVDADTIFPTGSTGKAFTVDDLAILVDQGETTLDDRVIDHLPGFQMHDPWVTREMTIRDLLVHRSGLDFGEGDLLFVHRSNLSRAEVVKRLRHLPPSTSFRAGFAYDNILYIVAGQLIEAVKRKTWETFTAEQLLRPAGTLHSTGDDEARFPTPNRAQPHARTNGALRGLGDQAVLNERDDLARNAAAAGGLAASANNIARWLLIQLAHGGLPGGGQLFSEEAHRQMWQPVTLQPIDRLPPEFDRVLPMFRTYVLVWDIQDDYRGTKLIWHGGTVLGFLTVVALLPERNVGFSIETNSEDGAILRGLMDGLLDHYLGLPKNDWPEKFIAYSETEKSGWLASIPNEGRGTRQSWTLAAGGARRGNLRGPLVWKHGSPRGRRETPNRLSIQAAGGRRARTLAV